MVEPVVDPLVEVEVVVLEAVAVVEVDSAPDVVAVCDWEDWPLDTWKGAKRIGGKDIMSSLTSGFSILGEFGIFVKLERGCS